MPAEARAFPPIADYAAIGDCASVALVSRSGSIDWLCWPRFDSPACFAALLDPRQGGHFRVGPVEAPVRVSRRYAGDTNVLETTFHTAGGVLRLRDLMPVARAEAYRVAPWPEHQILREVACVEGAVELEVDCAPRFDFGRRKVAARDRGACGFFFVRRGSAMVLRSEIPLRPSREAHRIRGRARLGAGERRYVSLSFDEGEPAVVPPLGDYAGRKVEQTLRWWEEWSGMCAYDGRYRAPLIRSALALKLLTFAPSGAVVAAATTSLPEKVGGVRNWDYRYCWLRDASFTVRALFELGYVEEGAAFFSWLLYTTRRTLPEVEILYDVFGGSRHREKELDHLAGYRDSRPVRVGNAADEQLQLDNYGALISAAFEFVARGGRLGRWQARMFARLGETICKRWREPDNGIWEIRASRRRHTHSNAMCWVGLDRLLRLAEAGHVEVPRERFRRVRDGIRCDIEERGWNPELGSYVSWFGGDDVDAALLLLSIYGYADPGEERMRRTYARLRDRLGTDGLLYRYPPDWEDGLPPGEGAFGICGFWQVEHLARAGEIELARRLFEENCGRANDVGLLSEEIDPASGELVGNFPQAFTHVGLINAALTLDEVEGRRRAPSPEAPREPGDLHHED